MTALSNQQTALNTANFATQVVGQLKQDILTGHFAPGEKLKMNRLKERYKVGVSPLREALSQLIVEQLVVVENQRGFRVHPISPEELADIYRTRSEVEALCVSQAIEKGDDIWESKIVAAAHQLKKAAVLLEKGEPENIQLWEGKHHAFHSAIAQGCNSPSLLQVRRSLYEKASRYRNLWLKQNMLDQKIFDANKKEHEALYHSILERDAATAVKIIKQHILSPYHLLKDHISFDE